MFESVFWNTEIANFLEFIVLMEIANLTITSQTEKFD